MPFFIFEKERTPRQRHKSAQTRAGLGGPGRRGKAAKAGGSGPAPASEAAPAAAALPARARSELLAPQRTPCKAPEGVFVCARAGGRRGGARGARRGREPPGPPPGTACCRAGSQRAAQLGVLASRAAAPGRSPLRGRGQAGVGARPRPSACPPAVAHKAEPAKKERPARDAPPAPRRPVRPPHPSIRPARQLTSAQGAAAAPGESEANFGAASPALCSVPGSLPGSRSPGPATPPLPSTAPAPGPAGRAGLLPALRAKVEGWGGVTAWPVPGRGRPGPGPRRAEWPAGWKRVCKVLGGRPRRAAGPRRRQQRLGSALAARRSASDAKNVRNEDRNEMNARTELAPEGWGLGDVMRPAARGRRRGLPPPVTSWGIGAGRRGRFAVGARALGSWAESRAHGGAWLAREPPSVSRRGLRALSRAGAGRGGRE